MVLGVTKRMKPQDFGQTYFDSVFSSAVGVTLSKFRTAYTEILAACGRFLEKLSVDEQRLRLCGERSKLKIRWDSFKNPEFLIRKAFPLPNERLTKRSEKVNHLVSHFYMAQWVMREELVPAIKGLTDHVRDSLSGMNEPFTWDQVDLLTKIEEPLERLWAFSANLLDVWQEYEVYLGESCSLLDEGYGYKRPWRLVSSIHKFEFIEGARTLLLSKHPGRHAPVPVIRSAMEVGVVRLVVDPEHTEHYKDKKLEPTRKLNAALVASVCQNKGIPIIYGHDALARIYDWASVSVHLGHRYPHEELWFALAYARSLSGGFIIANTGEEASHYYDLLVTGLVEKEAIKVRDIAQEGSGQ